MLLKIGGTRYTHFNMAIYDAKDKKKNEKN